MNTLRIEAKLAEKYKYKKLPADLSEKYRRFFAENIPLGLNINGGGALKTFKETLICDKYRRIVVGDYGAFVEFEREPDGVEFIIAPGQEYRVNDERYSKNVKYIWLTIPDNNNIKIYHQKKPVNYADYLPGMYYVSVHEVGAIEPACYNCKSNEYCISCIDTDVIPKCIWWGHLLKYASDMKG